MANKITQYVDEQLLYCIKRNKMFPQDVQHTATIWLTFGSCGLTLSRAYPRVTKVKHLNDWQNMTADEINRKLAEIEFETEV